MLSTYALDRSEADMALENLRFFVRFIAARGFPVSFGISRVSEVD